MTKFKPGDTVICIDNKGRKRDIQLNQLYTVSVIFNKNDLRLEELPQSLGFYGSRFKLAIDPLEFYD